MRAIRRHQQIIVSWADGAVLSDSIDLSNGCYGSLIVPSGLNGKTLQLITDMTTASLAGAATPANFQAVNMLASAKTLTTGKNSFTSDEIAEIGCAGPVKFKLNSAVSGAQQALLLWKS